MHVNTPHVDVYGLGQVGEELTDANTLLELVGQGLTDVTMHEVGHTLGLRHNFKGSTGFPYAKRTNARYIEQHGMTASVMDYVPLNLMSSNTRGNRPLPPLFSPTVGEYDIHAIRYGYQPLEEGNVTIRNQTFELPLEDPSLARVVEEVFTYATDEDDPGMEGPDPFTTLFDFSGKHLSRQVSHPILLHKYIQVYEIRIVIQKHMYTR